MAVEIDTQIANGSGASRTRRGATDGDLGDNCLGPEPGKARNERRQNQPAARRPRLIGALVSG